MFLLSGWLSEWLGMMIDFCFFYVNHMEHLQLLNSINHLTQSTTNNYLQQPIANKLENSIFANLILE